MNLIPVEKVQGSILFIRGQKVILDEDLASLYDVSTKRLNEQVKRNIKRFPADFMFQLKAGEFKFQRSQFATFDQKKGKGKYRKYLPYAFTEQGVAMLSSVLNSERAIQVNIEIMRAFVRLRKILASHGKLERKLTELEKRYDSQFKVVFDVIQKLITEPVKKKKSIGFIDQN